MKTILISTAITFLLITGCSSDKGLNIYEPDPAAALKGKINKHLTADMKVLQITLNQDSEKRPFTDVMGSATITSVNSADKTKLKGTEINFADDKTTDVSNTGYFATYNNGMSNAFNKINPNTTIDHGVNVTDIDYSKIKPNLEQGAKLITAEGLVNDGTDHYIIYLNKDKSKITHSFTLNAKKKEGATQLKGKRLTTNYYQIDFTADASGKVTMVSSE